MTNPQRNALSVLLALALFDCLIGIRIWQIWPPQYVRGSESHWTLLRVPFTSSDALIAVVAVLVQLAIVAWAIRRLSPRHVHSAKQ